jgi:hypothetical protein
LTHFVPSSLAQRYVSGVIQTALQLTVTVRYDPDVVTFLKQNWFMSAEWCTLDSLTHSSLAQKYVSGDIQTSLEITVTVTCDLELPVTVICFPELDLYVLYVILKGTGLYLQIGVHLTHFLIPLLHRYMCPS